MRTLKKLFVVTFFLAAAATIFVWYAAGTPAGAVWRAAHALKACDDVAFTDAVDIGATASGLVDELLGSPDLGASLRGTLGPGLGGLLASGMGALIKPAIGAMAGRTIADFVRSCRILGNLNGPLAGLAPLGAFLKRPLGPEYAAVLAWLHTERKDDTMVAVAVPARAGTLVVELTRSADRWRVTGAPGAVALLVKTGHTPSSADRPPP